MGLHNYTDNLKVVLCISVLIPAGLFLTRNFLLPISLFQLVAAPVLKQS